MKIEIYDRVRYIGRQDDANLLSTGDIGYVIEDYEDGNYEVEFSNSDGTTRTQVVLSSHCLELAKTI